MYFPDNVPKPKNINIIEIIQQFVNSIEVEGLEVEARLGKITHKITGCRVVNKVTHPIVFQALPFEYSFTSGVSKEDFQRYLANISQKLTPIRSNDVISINKNKNRKIYVNEENIRYEKKFKRKEITIYTPMYDYDVRISVSEETKIDKITPFKSCYSRERDRSSFISGKFSYDFTIVKPRNNSEKVYEIECEGKSKRFNVVDFVNIALQFPEKKN